MNFDYDSSSSSSVPVTDPNTDAFWPYTLDHGMANDCGSVEGICNGEPKLPGLWQIPMASIFEVSRCGRFGCGSLRSGVGKRRSEDFPLRASLRLALTPCS